MTIKHSLKKLIEDVAGVCICRNSQRGMDLHRNIKSDLPAFEGKVVFDVGANVGQSAVKYIKYFPNAQIYCFEPAQHTFTLLKNKFKHDKNVHCFNIALGDSNGRGELILNDTCDNYSLLKDSMRHDEKTATVEIETIDSFCFNKSIDRINFLKIDTEGYDLKVLLGALHLIDNKKIDMIEVEASMSPMNHKHVPAEDFKSFLESKSYFLFGIYDQIKEWPSDAPNLRRSNLVFISGDVIAAKKVMSQEARSD